MTTTKKKTSKKTTRKQPVRKASASKATKATTAKKPVAQKRLSLLDAAVTILAESKEPMSCKDMVERAIAKKLWSTSGKTPHATLHAAISREIATKGKTSRFEKTDRGRFRVRKGRAR